MVGILKRVSLLAAVIVVTACGHVGGSPLRVARHVAGRWQETLNQRSAGHAYELAVYGQQRSSRTATPWQ